MEDKIMSAPLRRVPVLCKINVSNLCTTLFYFVVAILASQLDLALGLAVDTSPTPPKTGTTISTTTTAPVVVPNSNDTSHAGDGSSDYGKNVMYDKSMLRRSFFVLIGFTCLAVVFFAVRWYRSRGKRKSKKYGVLATRSSDMELRPLDQEDDEEDMTVFDVNSK